MPLASWSRQSIIRSLSDKGFTIFQKQRLGIADTIPTVKALNTHTMWLSCGSVASVFLRKLLFRRVYTQCSRQTNYQPSIIMILDWQSRTNNPRIG
jgi:hypothetical protein